MNLQYILVKKKAGFGGDEKIYAKHATGKTINISTIVKTITEKTTASRGDVHLVIMALVDEVKAQLGNGNRVELGDLGAFKPAIKSNGVSTPEEFGVNLIYQANVQWQPSKYIKEMFAANVTYTRVSPKTNIKSAVDTGVNGGDTGPGQGE